jgi:hypothetical protein
VNKEEIVELAKLAGIYHAHDSEGQWNGLTNVQLLGEPSTFDAYAEKRIFEILEPLVKLVVIRERAAEAKKTAASIETLHALYEQASQQRDQLMDEQRAQVAAMRGRIQDTKWKTKSPRSSR